MNFYKVLSTDWLVTSRHSTSKVLDAKELFLKEDYSGSIGALDSLILHENDCTPFDSVDADTVLELIGWNLFFLRDYEGIEELIGHFEYAEISKRPALNLLRLWSLLLLGNPKPALEECERFIEMHSSPIHRSLGSYFFLKSVGLTELGFHSEAAEAGETAYQLLKLSSDKLSQFRCGNYLGLIYRRLSNYRESIKWYNCVLPYFVEKSFRARESMVHLNLGVTYYKLGDYRSALIHLDSSLELGKKKKWTHRECMANIGLGAVYRLNRDFGKAKEHLQTAYEQAQDIQFLREEALALEFMGDVYRDERNFGSARRFYSRAATIGYRVSATSDIVLGTFRRIGECHNLEGNQGEALTALNKALAMAKDQGDRYEAAVTLRVICETATNSGDLKTARKCIDESVTTLDEIESRHELAVSLLISATLKMQEVEDPRTATPRIVRLNEAWKQATMALELFIKVDVSWWTEQGRALVGRVSAMRNAQEKADKLAMSTGKAVRTGGYDPGDVIVHQSSVMRDTLQLCDMFAATNEPVLVTGETGTGKELVARRLHQHSDRAEGPLVIVNVAAIPDTMFEREFFGHVKGAFSGAVSNGEGYAARANGGTMFLDEIGDMPLELQPKLLRLLQESTYQALGDPKQRRTDIRLVAATNANLEQKVKEGTFRADLYYRLRILDLPLPPVRERGEDILPLMRHFLCVAARRPVDLAEYFSHESLTEMEAYEWPGNVREIAMVARQAHVSLQALGRVEMKLRRPDQSEVELKGQEPLAMAAAAGQSEPEAVVPVLSQSETVERSRVLVALDEAGGNRNNAAKALGIGRSTLYRKMVKFGIPTRRL